MDKLLQNPVENLIVNLLIKNFPHMFPLDIYYQMRDYSILGEIDLEYTGEFARPLSVLFKLSPHTAVCYGLFYVDAVCGEEEDVTLKSVFQKINEYVQGIKLNPDVIAEIQKAAKRPAETVYEEGLPTLNTLVPEAYFAFGAYLALNILGDKSKE